jgi:sugar O-acyltransferase (sialic acid O-acetyltransferase NeuD family)
MQKESILLVGAGGHARACIDVIELEDRYAIAGLIGLAHEVGTRILGYRVIGTDDDFPALARSYAQAIVAAGQIQSPDLRIEIFQRLKACGFQVPAIISPRAYVSRHARLGEGTIVMHGAVVNAGASIGSNCIVNSQALIEHDVQVGDHCHISTAAVVNGDVWIGSGSFVGSNACVRQGVRIGERSMVKMGERVVADLPSQAQHAAVGDSQ